MLVEFYLIIYVGASPCGHVAGHLCSTWHPSISVRTSITRSECPIRPMSISRRLHCVPLWLHDAFRIGFLTHSHEQSFSSRQKYARWDITQSPQATYHTMHHAACKLRWQVNHQITPTSNPCKPPKGWYLLYHQLCYHHDCESQEVASTHMWHCSRHYKGPPPAQNQGTRAIQNSFFNSKKGQSRELTLSIWLGLRRVCLDNLSGHLLHGIREKHHSQLTRLQQYAHSLAFKVRTK